MSKRFLLAKLRARQLQAHLWFSCWPVTRESPAVHGPSTGWVPVTSTSATSMTCDQLVWLNCRRQNSKIPSNSFTSNVDVDRTNSTLKTVDQQFFDCLRRSWEGRGRLLSRHSADNVELLRLPTTARPPSTTSTNERLLYNYALPSTPTCRWLRGSVNPSSSPTCRWPHGSDHVPPSSTRHRRYTLRTQRRDPSLRLLPGQHLLTVNDEKLVPADRELATPLGYAASF